MESDDKPCNRFDQAEAKLKSFTRSAVRTKAMLCLMSGEKDAGELEEAMGLRASTVLHSIKEMIESDLVVKTGKGYGLTNIGRIEARLLDSLVSTIVTLDLHRDFWLNHDLSGIPKDLQMKIGMLAESEIIASDPSAPMRVHENFRDIITRSREIHGVSSIIFPGYSAAIRTAFESGADIDLILTAEVLKAMPKEDRSMLKEMVKSDKFRLYSIGPGAKAAFTVTDKLLSLGLFRRDGDYDPGTDLICIGEGAIEWGMKLFYSYLAVSRPVREDSILLS